jgi:hypothetical protein
MTDATRRSFLEGTLAAAALPALAAQSARTPGPDPHSGTVALASGDRLPAGSSEARWWPLRADLAPARWIWMPCERVLPNTFTLFRREITLSATPRRATVWIAADSRYRLTVNGRRVQWGPAPCDPRQLDVDPAEIGALLVPGKNVIGVEVLFYGHPEGTWPGGKPGLLLFGSIEMPDGTQQALVSDENWRVTVDRAHRPGQAKRWFLRALQEEFDARLHPAGWDTPEFHPDERWLAARVLNCPADRPATCTQGGPWCNDTVDRVESGSGELRLRQIPPVRETMVAALRLAESGRVEWRRDPNDWFDFRVPDSFTIRRDQAVERIADGPWRVGATSGHEGAFATFEFREQIVGWPYFTIDAPAGTIVELMPQEAHDARTTAWLDTEFFSWSRFVCREGTNHFETFDFESLRWLQLHVRNASRPVEVREVGVRRRQFDWPHEPRLKTSEAPLQRLFDASINTIRNSAIETVVDGMARERQQYSGDGAHQLHAVRYAFGEPRIARRYLRTFSEGLTKDGYFLDCWPAADRLARIPQREVDGASWGPLLDHGVGFNFDCWHHYNETGELDALREPYPRLVRFADYLWRLRDGDGLLPVDNLGIPAVWMDHIAYKRQRHKQCAFNLYAAAMYRHALAPLAELMGDGAQARAYRGRGEDLLSAAVRRFWSSQRGVFVNNLPWAGEEREVRLCDRSLATAVLFDQCPGGNTAESVRALAECPPEMGFSYPANQIWRMWALGKARRADVIVRDLRTRWAAMRSVAENNTLQEDWVVRADSTSQWSHCALIPVNVAYMELAGIRPLTPGFARCRIAPQLGGLCDLALTAWTPLGGVEFTATPTAAGHAVRLQLPDGCEAELVVPAASSAPGRTPAVVANGLATYAGVVGTIEFHLAKAL